MMPGPFPEFTISELYCIIKNLDIAKIEIYLAYTVSANIATKTDFGIKSDKTTQGLPMHI